MMCVEEMVWAYKQILATSMVPLAVSHDQVNELGLTRRSSDQEFDVC